MGKRKDKDILFIDRSEGRDKYCKDFILFTKKIKRNPDSSDLIAAGLKDRIRMFGSVVVFNSYIKKYYPECKYHLITREETSQHSVDECIEFAKGYMVKNHKFPPATLKKSHKHNRHGIPRYDNVFPSIQKFQEAVLEKYPDLKQYILTREEKDLKSKDYLEVRYLELFKKSRGHVSRASLRKYKLDGLIYKYFDHIEGFRKYFETKYEKDIKDFNPNALWTDERMDNLQRLVSTKRRFVVTTAQANFRVFDGFYKSIKNYCKLNDAELLIIAPEYDFEALDQKIIDENIIFKHDVALNESLFITPIRILPTQIKPTTGLERLTDKARSIIIGSPKMYFEPKAQPNGKHSPWVMLTSGSLCLPDYQGGELIKRRIDTLADTMHMIGALVVEIEDEKAFHFRHITSQKDGSFIDLGVKYSPNTIKGISPCHLVCGDIHWGSHDPEIFKAWLRLKKRVNANIVVVHDYWDMKSINHHEKDSLISQAIKFKEGLTCLKTELDSVIEGFHHLTNTFEKVIIVKSNHDRFLERYLQKGDYAKDPQNSEIAHKLASAMMEGKDPLEWYYKEHLKIKNASQLVFLKTDQEYNFAGYALGHHGDLGVNGGRGNLVSFEKVLKKVVVGHSHSPGRINHAVQVGYSGGNHPYAKGLSSWLASSATVNPDGSVQQLNCINNKCYLDDKP